MSNANIDNPTLLFDTAPEYGYAGLVFGAFGFIVENLPSDELRRPGCLTDVKSVGHEALKKSALLLARFYLKRNLGSLSMCLSGLPPVIKMEFSANERSVATRAKRLRLGWLGLAHPLLAVTKVPFSTHGSCFTQNVVFSTPGQVMSHSRFTILGSSPSPTIRHLCRDSREMEMGDERRVKITLFNVPSCPVA